MKKNSRQRHRFDFARVMIGFIAALVLATGTFFLLVSLGFFDDTKPYADFSNWISAFIASLAFAIGAYGVYLTYRSMRLTQQAEEGALYLQMMNRYSGEQMVKALQLLGKFYTDAKPDLENNIRQWFKDKNNGIPYALDIEDARHLVKYFYRDLMQIVQASYFSRDLAKRICNTGGRHLFKNLILKMDAVLNVYSYENEFYPFDEIYDELDKEQKNIYNKKIICLIPARLDASRFPDKLLMLLKDNKKNIQKTVIRETYERMRSYGVFDEVYVVTNSDRIKTEIESHQGKVIYHNVECQSGTDRIGMAAADLDAGIIFNVQGDEPFIDKKPLEDMIALMRKQTASEVVASLMKKLEKPEFIQSSDYVKVICNKSGNAMYFSRSVIPHDKKNTGTADFYEHVGVYAFSKPALMRFMELKPSPLEILESVECLRFLENDIPIKMVETDTFLLEIDTSEDLVNVNNHLLNGNISLT